MTQPFSILPRNAGPVGVPPLGPGSPALAGQKTHRLVVVVDDAAFRRSLCDLFEAHGYPTPVDCSGPRQLIRLLMEEPFDLVLLDLCMPEMSGLDVLRMLRQAKLEVAVVVVSGDQMIDSAIGALRLGANDYVRKPYAPEMLLHTVANVLRRHDLERSHRLMAAQLERSERMHRFLVNTSPDLIFTLDEKGNFAFVSERVGMLIGCSADELEGEPFLSIVFDEDHERTRYVLERVARGECTTELRLVGRDDAAYRHFEVKLIPVEFSALDAAHKGVGRHGVYVVARDISDKKNADEHLVYLAYHDVLTGLPNRALFRDRLGLAMTQAKRSAMKAAVMFIDLDRFKLANDTFGHQLGDELIKEVARRLQGGLRETNTLARIGGDEFMVLLPAIRSADDAAHVAGKLVAEMARPYVIAGNEVFLSASLGIALWPDDGGDIETLLRHADQAMYHVKSSGKNNFGFFVPSLGQASDRRLAFENEIRHALDERQFELHFQPQVDAQTLRVIGLEALVRWRHPLRGLVAPGSFIPVVEEIGLMPALTTWVLDEACRKLRCWRDQGLELHRMSINVSPAVLDDERFVEHLCDALARYAIAHADFEVEITENIFVGDRQKVIDSLRRISQQGIRIAIDDFGTQYSSLSYLRHLPVNTLKIDQSFVREIEHVDDPSPIVRAVIAIAAGLNLNVVAEGVEGEVQAEFLRRLGCREMQGYLYGRPMPAESIAELLRRRAASLPLER